MQRPFAARTGRVHFCLLLALVLALLPAAALSPKAIYAQDAPDSPLPVYLPTVSNLAESARIAAHTPAPSTVTIAGNLQSELGCAGDWDPACAATHLAYDAGDDAWQAAFNVPAGSWEYKAALNNSWDENYGQNAAPNGPNIALNLGAGRSVKFYYHHDSHWVTDNANSRIVTVPGSFQSEIGCPGDWDPGCLRSWLLDPDGDGIATRTVNLPAGSYEAKAAINEAWDENYGAGGAPNGPNIPFTLGQAGNVTFRFDQATNILTVQLPGAGPDNNVLYDGLGHNSHEDLFRVPFGAVTPGTEVILRFRTFHNDVTSVRARVWNLRAGAEFFLDLQPAATDISCYDDALTDAGFTCDFWEARYTPAAPTVLYYRFIVRDGTATAYYADDDLRDGGWGVATPGVKDTGYVIAVYDAGYAPVEWMQDAVVYQIFPDRFRDGRANNNPSPNEPRYGFPPAPLDRILNKPWGALPEGYCRHYESPAQPCTEGPRGRDYFGGDLRGVQQRLNYLEALGVTAIYFNPIFEAASNHAYDTQDYFRIDHFFGSNQEFEQLAREAGKRGIRTILDGVFNHVSSDSPYFDRYGHFASVGACESVDSPYRSWFYFRPDPAGPCAGPNGTRMNYDAWFGFDSLPVLNKNEPAVRLLFNGEEGVARYWLEQGAAGWRLDVMGDPSFPDDFWREFRAAVKDADPNAVIIGELWKKDEVLPKALGDMADSSMNYRFRNAVMGYFGRVDNKGFPDDGQQLQNPSVFANKMISVREDSPDALYYTFLNILDSHDTQRILWSLTPGDPRNREQREFNAANVAVGKAMLRLAAVVQMTTPGAPTIYYGDEVGVTGDDDPDDRRTFPWNGGGPFGSGGDSSLLAHYQRLTALRAAHPVLRDGALTFLLADDAADTLAYLMRTEDAAAVVAINRNAAPRTLAIALNGALPDAVMLRDALGAPGTVQAANGVLEITLPAYAAAVLLPAPGQDLSAPAAPAPLAADPGSEQVQVSWGAVPGAVAYILYRSPLEGGGYVEIARTNGTSYTDTGLENARTYCYAVRAVDAAGNIGPRAADACAMPRFAIGWANLQWPPTLNHTISAINRTDTVYGQVWIDGVTSQPGATPSLLAQAGFGPQGSNPAGDPAATGWTWVDASFNNDAGNNDEFKASFLPEAMGAYDYVYRYSTSGGAEWLYADLNGPVAANALPANPGKMTVTPSSDTTPPATPAGLRVVSESPEAIELAWDAVTGDPTLYGYEVLRAPAAGGPWATLARVTAAAYTDATVSDGGRYSYTVQAVDTSFNRSARAEPVGAVAARRLVTVVFNVTVPATTDGTGRSVYIAGTLQRLTPPGPEWNPGGQVLTRVDATRWSVTLTGFEGTALAYKYTLGSWDYVEKGAACEELADRTLTLEYGASGTQTVNDTVANWRNVAPCGN